MSIVSLVNIHPDKDMLRVNTMYLAQAITHRTRMVVYRLEYLTTISLQTL